MNYDDKSGNDPYANNKGNTSASEDSNRVDSSVETGFFAEEKRGISKGIFGGIVMMTIAALWFFGGLAANYIFYYPPILFIIGLYSLIKGIITKNVYGQQEELSANNGFYADQDATAPVRSINQLFDVERGGKNYTLIIAFVLSSVLGMLIMPAVSGIGLISYSVGFPAAEDFAWSVGFAVLNGLLLVAIGYSVRSVAAFSVLWGVTAVVVMVGSTFVLDVIRTGMPPDMTSLNNLSPFSMLIQFAISVVWIVALDLGLKVGGFRLMSFVVAGGVVSLLHSLAIKIQIFTEFGFDIFNTSITLMMVLTSMVRGIISAVLIYAAFKYHFKKSERNNPNWG